MSISKGKPLVLPLENGIRRGKLYYHHTTRIDRAIIDITGDVMVGKHCTIYDNVTIFTHKHPDWTTSRRLRKDNNRVEPVNLTIGNDVFIGFGAMIIAIESIGDGAIIGAGAVVTKSIPPYEIWAGNPAKKIGERPE